MCSAPTSTWCLRSRTLLAAAFLLLAAAAPPLPRTSRSPSGSPDRPARTRTRQDLTASLVVTNGPIASGRSWSSRSSRQGGGPSTGGDAFTLAAGDRGRAPPRHPRPLRARLPGRYRPAITVRETREGGASATVELPVTVRAEPGLVPVPRSSGPRSWSRSPRTRRRSCSSTPATRRAHPSSSVAENLGLPVELHGPADRLEPGGQLAGPRHRPDRRAHPRPGHAPAHPLGPGPRPGAVAAGAAPSRNRSRRHRTA